MHLAVLFLSLTLGFASEFVSVPAAELDQQQDTLLRSKVISEKNRRLVASSPLQSVDAAGIERMGAHGLNEVLKTFAGVSVRDYGGIGGLKTVSVRSLGAQHTAVVYDDVAVSDAQNGQIDISRFMLENIESLSVEVGPSDEIFRSARTLNSSGVLNIVSKAPVFDSKSCNVAAQMSLASFGTYTPYISVQQRLSDSFLASVNARWLTSDGNYPFILVNGSQVTREIRLNSDVDNFSTEADFYGRFKRGNLHAKLNWQNSERGLPGSVVLYVQDPSERLWDKDLRSSVSYKSDTTGKWRYNLSGSYIRSQNRYVNSSALYPQPEDDRYLQQESGLSGILEYRLGERLRFVFAEDAFANALESRWRVVDGLAGESLDVSRLSSVSALSAQYSDDSFVATASISGTFISESKCSGSPAPDRHRLSPSVSLSWHLNDDLMLRASARDAFRVPTFNDLYYARIGNTALVPEKSGQVNLGATWSRSLGILAFSATADTYVGNVRDKIIAVPTLFIWKMRNVGRVRMAGTELTVAASGVVTQNMTLRVNANYSFQSAEDITDPSSKNYGHQIQYVARHCGNVLLSLESPWVSGSYTVSAVGKRYFLPQNIPSNVIPAYADHSVSLYRDFKLGNCSVKISGEVLNLLNDNYDVVRYYPMPGRNYRLTLKFKY